MYNRPTFKEFLAEQEERGKVLPFRRKPEPEKKRKMFFYDPDTRSISREPKEAPKKERKAKTGEELYQRLMAQEPKSRRYWEGRLKELQEMRNRNKSQQDEMELLQKQLSPETGWGQPGSETAMFPASRAGTWADPLGSAGMISTKYGGGVYSWGGGEKGEPLAAVGQRRVDIIKYSQEAVKYAKEQAKGYESDIATLQNWKLKVDEYLSKNVPSKIRDKVRLYVYRMHL